MTNVITYLDDNGKRVAVYPNPSSGLSMAQIAARTVPAGKTWSVVDDSTLAPTTGEILQAEREGMVCAPTQMRVTLRAMGLLDLVNQIASADPDAAIVWEYARDIYRLSPFIVELQGNPVRPFTDTEIDDIFRAAMAVSL